MSHVLDDDEAMSDARSTHDDDLDADEDQQTADAVVKDRFQKIWGELNEDQKEYLNTIDKLRDGGLNSITSLPQLVVCGDQSAGKSSVLEAISGIPFPSKETLGTRFATELILRRVPQHYGTELRANIIPDKDTTRPRREQRALESFSSKVTDMNEFPSIIKEAAKCMGLEDGTSNDNKRIVKDVLRIEVSGPKQPHLTLVDLPGLIQVEEESGGRPEEVKDLVKRYIKEPRSIILPIITAKNDIANQSILKIRRS